MPVQLGAATGKLLLRQLHQAHNLHGPALEQEPLVSQLHALLAAAEQLPSQLSLQSDELAAERRLRDVQRLSSPRDGPFPGNGQKRLQQACLHEAPLYQGDRSPLPSLPGNLT